MTVEELSRTPMVVEAETIAAEVLDEQIKIEELALLAERQARERLRGGTGENEATAAAAGQLVDTRISRKQPVLSPLLLEERLPLSERSAATTLLARRAIGDILLGTDDRLAVITGPCSIHDADAALEYAENVNRWREQYGDDLEIIMRIYTEKTRSELGWKGLVYDPRLDGSDDINLGLTLSRLIAGRVTDTGVPIAMERLNALTPQHLNGLVAYDTIGARNVTDQKAREYASGTSSPVGFKNAPDGNVDDAVSGVISANHPHTFLGMSPSGMLAEVTTTGNELAHIVLRGGKNGPNYYSKDVVAVAGLLAKKGVLPAIVIDASHGNSGKDAAKQRIVATGIGAQIAGGQPAIKGVMLESNLIAGKQELTVGCDLLYGQSITDACIDVKETELILSKLAGATVARRRTLSRAS